ncbi:MAG: trypsin-like peptidase domain-containing protein [Planctomycetes bacterium]|nr:trypsin-like peptidase domain-containing protein [Planctomycetota bacterium]
MPDAMSPDTLKRVQEAAVFITSRYQFEGVATLIGYGSGFVVDPSGLVVTNRHVVEAGRVRVASVNADPVWGQLQSVKVRLSSGTAATKEYDAQVLTMFEMPFDLALLRITPDAPLSSLELGDEEKLSLTQRVWAAGFPQGAAMEDWLDENVLLSRNPNGPDLSIRGGEVASMRRDALGKVKLLETTCPTEHGNSGGPLLDALGRVVGINTYLVNPEAHASKSYGSLPVAHVHTKLGALLAARRERQDPNVIRIDPTAGQVRTLAEALSRSSDGDIIELPGAGRQVDAASPIQINGLVTIRGAADGTSALAFQKQLRCELQAHSHLVLTNVNLQPKQVTVHEPCLALTGPGTCFASRVSLGAHGMLSVAGGAQVHAFGCEAGNFNVAGRESSLRMGYLRATSSFKISRITAGAVSLFGCQMRSLDIDGTGEQQPVMLHGCSIVETNTMWSPQGDRPDMRWGGRVVASGCAFTRVCLTAGGSTLGAGPCAPADLLFENCWFQNSMCITTGDSRSHFRQCGLVSRGSACLYASERGAVITAEASQFLFPGLGFTRRLTDEERDDMMRKSVYGIRTVAGATVKVRDCTFSCPVRAIPLSPAPDPDAFRRDGNSVR